VDNRPVWQLLLRRYTRSSTLQGNAAKFDEMVGRLKRVPWNLLQIPSGKSAD
jgi:hypothetical protein